MWSNFGKPLRAVDYLEVTSLMPFQQFCEGLRRATDLPTFRHTADEWFDVASVQAEDEWVEVEASHERACGPDESIFTSVLITEDAPPEWDHEWFVRNVVLRYG
jgi:hypothetical protein